MSDASARDISDVVFLDDHAALLRRSGNDPFVQYDARLVSEHQPVALGAAVAFVRLPQSRHRGPSLTFIGADPDVVGLMRWYAARSPLAGVRSISVPRQLEPQLNQLFDVTTGGDWNWMWTTAEPGQVPTEEEVITLDDQTHGAEIGALNAVGNPDAESEPGEGVSEYWVGMRARGALVGAAAIQRTSAGAVQRDGVATLGVYAGNDTARRLYAGLGYLEAHAWASRRLATSVR